MSGEARDSVGGRQVLVTGASSGIGAAIAVAFAQAGAQVTLAGRAADRLTAVAERLDGGPHRSVVADLSTPGGVHAVATVAADAEVVVHNAGLGWSGPLGRLSGDELAQLLAVNLHAPLELTRRLLPGLLERGRGHLVFVGSVAGLVGVTQEAAYGATKAGLLHFAEGLRYELAGTGVGVTTVSPGVVDTAFFARRGTPPPPRSPRPVAPERVAAAVLRAVADGGGDVTVPGWLALPARLQGAWPQLYRRLAGRAQRGA